jgi:hypothetical protein
MLESTARALSGDGAHPMLLVQAVREEAARGITNGLMPNVIQLRVGTAEYGRVAEAWKALQAEIVVALEQTRRERGLRVAGPWFVSLARAHDGRTTVEASSGAREPVAAPRTPTNPTRRLSRVRGITLSLDDGERVSVTHVPFVIGRERGCDLVLADLAVSRRHAEIVRDEAGDFVLRDLGSRNQIVSDGATVESVVLEPGMVVTLGGTRISIGAGE